MTLVPTDTALTVNAGSLTVFDGSAGASSDYQVITTNATNNPNGIFIDTTAVGFSNLEVDTITGLTGS